MSTSPATATTESPQWQWERRKYYLSLISSAGLIFGALWGVYQYVNQQREQEAGRAAQATADREQKDKLAKEDSKRRDAEAVLRRKELALMVYREKRDAYRELVDVATELMTARDKDMLRERLPRFLNVYYGRVHTVPDLDDSVRSAKIDFANDVRLYVKQGEAKPEEALYDSLMKLTKAVQAALDLKKLEADITSPE